MLEQLFGSRTRAKLLRLFFTNPGSWFYVREACRKIEEHMNSVRRELDHLLKLGLLLEQVRDRKKYYCVNTEFVLYPELHSLLVKARVMFQKDFLTAIKKIGSVKLLVLTGLFSGMPNTLTDVLIVGKVNREKLRRLLQLLQKQIDEPIRYTIFSTREFHYRNDLTDRFIFHILENKKIIMVDRLGAVTNNRNNKNENDKPEKLK
ncbi:MAG: hypothetical protein V1853_00490 [bacterium]